jgi:hypothetical protein
MSEETKPISQGRVTRVVSPEIFKQVYDLPLSLPGKHRRVTTGETPRATPECAPRYQSPHL